MTYQFSNYQPSRVGTLFVPQAARAMVEGKALQLPPYAADKTKVFLLLVDAQVDFIHSDGALSVPGAIDDTRRTIDWIYANLRHLTTIAASLDTHLPFQIFHPAWWEDKNGKNPDPFTQITLESYLNKTWRSRVKLPYEDANGNIVDWNQYYLEQLETQAKKTLMIWPYHCLFGTPGQGIEPSLLEAIMFHSGARYTQPQFLPKGTIPQTENYSILEPEVKVSTDPNGGLNTSFLDILSANDLIYIAGQAKSHCVYETINSIVKYFTDKQAKDVLKRIRILEDCTSPVWDPQGSFKSFADQAFFDLANKHGLKLVKSTDPLG